MSVVPAEGFITHEALVSLLDASPDGILLVAGDGRIRFSNIAAQQLFGHSREEMLDVAVETLIPPRYRAHHVADRTEYVRSARPRPMGLGLRLQGLRKDGSELPIEISLAPMDGDGERLIVTIVRDATEQRAIEEKRLRYARSRAVEEVVGGLEAIVWESPSPDRQSLTYLGGREGAFLGYARERWLAEGFWLSIVHGEDRISALAFAGTALERDTFELEYRLIAADGDIHQVRDIVSVTRDAGGEIERLRGVIVDVTERHELEDRLTQAQKMEAVGQLAGGIAHDFNNLLTIISGHARRLRGRRNLEGAHADLDQLITAAERAADLTRQLLTFARRGQTEVVLVDLGESIRSLEPMIRRLIDADIVFDIRFGPRLPSVLIDRTQFEQIVMNLVINSSDAMRDGGTMTIMTRTRRVSDEEGARHGSTGGDYVELSVADTGIGMHPDVRARIFEPFFTTKQDKGTGMGLATVYGIIKRAAGWVEVDSEPGLGAAFRVVLPVATRANSDTAQNMIAASDGATLLLVEDEPALRQLVVSMLGENG